MTSSPRSWEIVSLRLDFDSPIVPGGSRHHVECTFLYLATFQNEEMFCDLTTTERVVQTESNKWNKKVSNFWRRNERTMKFIFLFSIFFFSSHNKVDKSFVRRETEEKTINHFVWRFSVLFRSDDFFYISIESSTRQSVDCCWPLNRQSGALCSQCDRIDPNKGEKYPRESQEMN